ncbi:MAG TPA: hypothetical protein VFI65_22385 [Streptosporangiaceae bacterium]|nr:hypothetical protein [Streptosporangiaceae bacterium]
MPPAVAVSRAPAVAFTQLTLLNGWRTYPGASHAAVANISGIVTFKGSIQTDGSNSEPFTLPKAFRPATNVYVAVALCSATKGRLFIRPTGLVTVSAEGGTFSNAACVTSLDGVSFARSATSFTKLKLKNGWLNAPFGTSAAAVRVIAGTAHFKGAIFTHGTKADAFTLPTGFRPAATVSIPVDLCDDTKGQLKITPNGVAAVQAENSFSDAACFTSLDGLTFATSAKSFTALSLKNGWQPNGPASYKPAARAVSGLVQFEGAIRNVGGNLNLAMFTLPKGLRPAKLVYIEVNLCNAHNGRLYIQPDGQVFVYVAGGKLKYARCLTSLDGAWFAR